MTGLDVRDLKHCIVAPTIAAMGLSDPGGARTQLMTGIALVETNAAKLRQDGGGPALGLWQVEPFTHDDGWTNFLLNQPDAAMTQFLLGELPARLTSGPVGQASVMIRSLVYGCGVATVRFLRSPVLLPPAGDAPHQNQAWRLGYNTLLGAGAIDPARTALFQAAIDA